MEKRLDISVVVPLYNEEESLPELTAWIDRVARENGLSYEIVFVDDGSTDGSWETLERLKEHYRALRAIRMCGASGFAATTASRPHSTADSPPPKATWSSRWTPTCRTRPTKFPTCAA